MNWLTIITVCKNDSSRLLRTIESVERNSISGVEHLVIDGASTDSTLDLLKHINRSNFNFISQPDSGVYDAMQSGLQIASGRWIYFLNAGDTFVEDFNLSKLYYFLLNNSFKLILGDVLVYDGEKSSSTNYPKNINYNYLISNSICHQAMIFDRNLVIKLGGFNTKLRFAADFDLFLRCYLAIEKIEFARYFEVIAYYPNWGISSSYQAFIVSCQERRDSLLRLSPSFWNSVKIIKSFSVRTFLASLRVKLKKIFNFILKSTSESRAILYSSQHLVLNILVFITDTIFSFLLALIRFDFCLLKLGKTGTLDNQGDTDSVNIIMCTYSRLGNLFITLLNLGCQNLSSEIILHIWNNNPANNSILKFLERNVLHFFRFKIKVYYSDKNIGGFARFLLADQIPSKYVVFIDDDQVFCSQNELSTLWSERRSESIIAFWGFRFLPKGSYLDRIAVQAGNLAHYCGTGGMVVDTSIFSKSELYEIPAEWHFIEDLWLSCIASQLNWQLAASAVNMSFFRGKFYGLFTTTENSAKKSAFLNFLRNNYNQF